MKFEEHLDKLFDITKCRCPLLHCEEANCPGCPKSSSSKFPACHMFCECPAEQKIPVLERSFILAQREKVGTKSTIMIQNMDKKENKIQLKKYETQQKVKFYEDKHAEKIKKKELDSIQAEELVADFFKEVSLDEEENEKENE